VLGINTEKQRARSTQTTIATRIDIRSTHFADRMWIFTDSTCTNKYDRGWDGSKLMGSPRAPQLFAMETDGNYQINAVADMNNTDLGFITGEEKEFTIKFTHENADKQYSSIYLYDLVAKTSTDITLSGSEYKFTAEPNNKIVKRFKIITSNLKDTTNEASQMKIFSADGMIMIQNNSDESGELKIYDTTGRFVQQASFGANNSTAVFKNLSPGVYLAKTISNGKELTQTFLVR
ncbi:MAG: T9SS type A sorting domain-containing protein, partial [Paludibacter sp.]